MTTSKAVKIICANFGSPLPQALTDKKGATIIPFQQAIIIQQVHSNYNNVLDTSHEQATVVGESMRRGLHGEMVAVAWGKP